MAIKPLNSVAGFSVGETPVNIILANGDVTTTNITTTGVSNLNSIGNVKIAGGTLGQVIVTDGAGNLSFSTIDTALLSNGNSNVKVAANGNVTVSVAGNANILTVTGVGANIEGTLGVTGNISAAGLLTNKLYYSNGQPWDLQEAAGSNRQIQYNDGLNNFGASANFTFNSDTNLLTVVGNIDTLNASLGNLATANFINVSSNTTTANLTVNSSISGNTANFSGNVVVPNLSVNLELAGNTANFTGNVGVLGLKTDNLYYSNGTPWDLQQAAGANYEIQYNIDDNFAASANFTYNDTTQQFTVLGNAQVNNANLGNLAIANYVNVASNTITGNLTVNNSISGDTANFSGNVVVPNLTVNLELQANTANFDGNVVMDNWLTVSNTANVGNLRTDNLLYANGQPWDLQLPAGSTNQIQYNDNGSFGASANFAYDDSVQSLTVSGTSAQVTVGPNTVINNSYISLGNTDFANGTPYTDLSDTYVAVQDGTLANNDARYAGISAQNGVQYSNGAFSGAIDEQGLTLNNSTDSTYSYVYANGSIVTQSNNGTSLNSNSSVFTWLVSDGNGFIANAAGAYHTQKFEAPQLVSNVAVGTAPLVVTSTTRVANLNVANAGVAETVSNAAQPNITSVGTLTDLTVSGNINGGNIVGTFANGNSNVKIYANSNVEVSVNGTANVATFTDTEFLFVGEIKTTNGNMLSNGNVTANGFINGANANITGQATLGSVKTANITAPTGNITISAAGSDNNIYLAPSGTGVVDLGMHRITQLADPVNPNDAATKEYVDAIGGSGLTIHNPVNVEANSALGGTYAVGGTTQTTTDITGGKTIQFSSNHGLSVNDGIVWDNSFNGIIGGEAYWVQTVPALNQITIRDGYFGAEVTTLTNGTGLSEPSRANPGVGATLTNSGANVALNVDGIAVANGWRVLVYSEANAAHNGIYDVTDTGNATAAWVLTRSSDMDKYIPASSSGMSKGDYVFVTSGNTGAGESYVLTAPDGEIIIGTDNIFFTQFSSAGAYTAGNGISITGTIISANTDGVTTDIVGGNIVVKSSAQLTTPNIGDATGTSVTLTGNASANNLSISNLANVGANLTVSGNIFANYAVVANGNVSGLNLTTSGNVEAGGNILAENITANSTVFAANANVSGTTITDALTVNNAITGNTANFSSNVVLANLTVNNSVAGNTANFSGNVVVNNLGVNLELAGNTANFSGNVAVAGLLTDNLYYANGNVWDLQQAAGSNNQIQYNIDNNFAASANFTYNDTTQVFAVNGTANVTTANISGVVNVGNSTVNTALTWGSVTTTSVSANQTIASFSVTGITGVEFLVKGIDATGGKYSVATVIAVTDGANVDYSTFGTVNLGGYTGSLAVNISSGFIRLQVSPSSSNSTVWTTQYRVI